MEIERKWMVQGWPQGLPLLETYRMDQGYISVHPTVRIRREALQGGRTALVLCFKGAPDKTGLMRQFYIQRLVAAMLAVAENAGLSVNQVLADRQANLFETIGKIYTADQMQNFLMDEVAVPVMDLLTEFRQSSSSELVKNVLALIKQTRGDITLNECADRLNYNPSYIWKVLRTEKDTSFSDLANNEKLEMAKELLLTSDMTVVQIAETLNYSNVQNFIRFFSKKVGMTPGKYRKDYQNEKK